MKKYIDTLTPEQIEKYKDSKYFKLLENATYSESKKGGEYRSPSFFYNYLIFSRLLTL